MKIRNQFVLFNVVLSGVFSILLYLAVGAAFDRLGGGEVALVGPFKTGLLAGCALFVAIGTAGVHWLGQRFSGGLDQAVRVVEKIALGEIGEKLPMGTAVNCSSHKGCNEPECPSFRKVDHCWVSSGSYAVIKGCPRAKRGVDCRTCEIYGAHNEIEELGSIVNALSNNLYDREHLALTIARGDLLKEVPLASDKDSLGKALQTMNNSLRQVIGQVQTASMQIATGSGQVAEASQTLSQGAVQQASALEQIASSMTELESRTRENTENASLAESKTKRAMQSATRGAEQMVALKTAMGEISQASEDIHKIIKTIDEIAFQTNLLALNAAVEAARAGQHGKGFAVVAEEVRNLAARSAKAAAETAHMIQGAVKKAENGAELSEQTSSAFEEIVEGIRQVEQLVDVMTTATQQQAEGLAQINQGLGQVDTITQRNAASSEESAAAAEELAGQLHQLTEILSRFNVADRGQVPQADAEPSSSDGQSAALTTVSPVSAAGRSTVLTT